MFGCWVHASSKQEMGCHLARNPRTSAWSSTSIGKDRDEREMGPGRLFLLLCYRHDCAHTCLCRYPELARTSLAEKELWGEREKRLFAVGLIPWSCWLCSCTRSCASMKGRDCAGGEKELTEEGTFTTFNGAASFKCLFFLVVKTDNLCNLVKLWPSSHFNKNNCCDLTGEHVASSVLQPACSILSPNTHLMSNCFSIFCFIFLKKFHSMFWEICCCTYPSASLC